MCSRHNSTKVKGGGGESKERKKGRSYSEKKLYKLEKSDVYRITTEVTCQGQVPVEFLCTAWV